MDVHDHLVDAQSLGHPGVGPDPGVSQGMTFGNVVEIKVVWYDENSYFTLFPDVLDHLGEVQSLGHPGVGPHPGVSQGMTYWQCC